MPTLMSAGRIPGLQAALVSDDRVVWTAGYGAKNASTGAPVTDETIFEAASLAKPLFAYAVMRLVDRGTIDLDAPIASCLPRGTIEAGLGHPPEPRGSLRPAARPVRGGSALLRPGHDRSRGLQEDVRGIEKHLRAGRHRLFPDALRARRGRQSRTDRRHLRGRPRGQLGARQVTGLRFNLDSAFPPG
ncbi:MAG: beta-lactamase family protein [Candidatus Krumholzibacteriota bacterium]|nr:beta-lactamase family protein [Candidatus Krumholzibacteriota bacterium]